MEEVIRRLHADLAEVSSHLLDRPLVGQDEEGSSPAGAPLVLGPVAESLLLARTLLRWVRAALDDVAVAEDLTRLQRTTSPFPKTGVTGFPAESVQRVGAVIAPTRWTTWIPSARAPRDVTAWLMHVLEFVSEDLERRTAVIRKSLDDALSIRASESAYFQAEVDAARFQRAEVDSMLARVGRLHRQVSEVLDGRVTSSPRLPSPLPRSRAWRRLLDLFGEASSPAQRATRLAEMLAVDGSMTASAPFLYQRWCGWRLHQALLGLGWASRADPIPALLLGGVIEYRRRERSFKLLVEPRLTESGPAMHGLRATRGEVTPDLVLMVPESAVPGAFVDAYVLDPTLSLAPEVLLTKGKYAQRVQLEEPKRVAGTLAVAHPMRSWAMAPLDSSNCVLNFGDWRGITGTIPMSPLSYSPAPLRAWLTDIAYLRQTEEDGSPEERYT